VKNIVIFVFVLLFAFLGNSANADHPAEPRGPALTEPEPGKGGPAPKEPAGPGFKGSEPGEALPSPVEPVPGQQIGEIFFGAGTISTDGKYLYVILDKFLFQYVLPSLDLRRKAVLDIAVAPVTPSISISKDSKYLYIIYNGILYQIDAVTFKIKKRSKIRP